MNRALKIIICASFVLILMIKMFIPVTAVFISHFSKQIKTTTLLANQENDDEKSSDSKDAMSKDKKEMDKAFVHLYSFVPLVVHINLLYHQQEALFKQTHFPAVLTPPPNAA